ncbi:MAG: FkbM family methyltransferase [Acidobacteriota bacterium]|nr:FkbM family methyltransferase [Acidobacteriota bacterium]
MNRAARDLLRRVVPRPLRTFARQPVASLTGFYHHAKFRVCGTSRVDMTPGWTVQTHPASALAFHIHADDPAYRRELRAFLGLCTPGMRLIDVGASYGIFSLAALHAGGPGAHVIAVEPSPHAAHILHANLDANGVASRVRVVREALAAPHAQSIPVLTTGAGQAHMMIRGEEGRADTTAVAATTLDVLAAGAGCTHLKIDVEGFEIEVLKGARGTLTRERPLVALELHCALLRELGENPADAVAILRECGYTIELDGAPADDAAILGAHIANLVCRPS